MELIINRLFVCVFLLSISGFISSGIYLILEKYIFKLTSAKFMVFINTIVLLSFVIPFYYISSIIDGSESNFITYDLVVFEGQNLYSTIVIDVRDKFPFIKYIDSIWFIGVIIFITIKTIMYLYVKARVKRTSFVIQSEAWTTAFENIKGIYSNENVLLLGSNDVRSPFTVGILHKFIVIPAVMINALDGEELNFILSHECYHASRNDVGRKVLMIILNCLNWFNPLFYFLKDNLSSWMEIACDEAVTENFNSSQKKKYASLIIKSLELEKINNNNRLYFICFGSNNVKYYKRRIIEIMREKNKNNLFYKKFFVTSLAIFSLTCSNVVAKAADGPVNQLFSENISILDSNETQVKLMPIETQDDFLDYVFKTPDENFRVFEMNTSKNLTYKIISLDSEIENINSKIDPQHVHTIKDAVIMVHEKHSDGSCTTTYYEGKQCTGCGLTWKGDIIQIITQPKCQH